MSYLNASCGISGLFHGVIDRLNRLTVYAVFLGFLLVQVSLLSKEMMVGIKSTFVS